MRSSQTQDQSGGERQQFEQGVHRDGFRAEFSLSFPKLKGFAFQVKKFVKQKKELDALRQARVRFIFIVVRRCLRLVLDHRFPRYDFQLRFHPHES